MKSNRSNSKNKKSSNTPKKQQPAPPQKKVIPQPQLQQQLLKQPKEIPKPSSPSFFKPITFQTYGNHNQFGDDSIITKPLVDPNQIQNVQYDLIQNLELNLRCRYQQIKQMPTDQQVPVMIQLHTKEQEEKDKSDSTIQKENAKIEEKVSDEAQRHIGIDLICVLDHSGSMGDHNKMQLANQTLLYILDQLLPQDRICIIQFDDDCQRLSNLVSVNEKNKEELKKIIQKIHHQGGTNIAKGMNCAFQVMTSRKYINDVTSIFLLSDGLDSQAQQQTAKSFNSIGLHKESFTIHTFGFGKDHDPILMRGISDLKDGNFYYIEHLDKLAESFIDALGILFTVVAKKLILNISVNPDQIGINGKKPNINFRVKKSFGQFFQKIDDYHYKIEIPQIISGVSKDFIMELDFPAQIEEVDDNNRNVKVMNVNFTCIDLKGKEIKIEKSLTLPILNQENQQILDEDGEVMENYCRVKAAQAIEDAINESESGQFEKGKLVIDKELERIDYVCKMKNVNSKKLEMIKRDLQEQQKLCSNQEEFKSKGGKIKMMMVQKCHMEEKSKPSDQAHVLEGEDAEEMNIYANVKQKKMMKQLKKQ